jgi:hypothetical protein
MRRAIVMGLLGVLLCSRSDGQSSGLPFDWDVVRGNSATAGVSLSIKEASRSKVGEKTVVAYELRAPGFIASDHPIVALRKMNDTYMRMMAVLPDTDSEVFNPSDPTRIYPENFNVGNYVLGEALDLAIFTSDGKKHAQARVIPFPIEAKGSGDCRASAQAVMTEGREFAILAQGFAPGEELRFQSTYKDKTTEKTLKASPDGSIHEIVRFKAKDKGTATHTIIGKAGAVSLTHAVGKDALVVQ